MLPASLPRVETRRPTRGERLMRARVRLLTILAGMGTLPRMIVAHLVVSAIANSTACAFSLPSVCV